ncbi:hypothetical protein NHX12_033999 [Muraenolepis orangiensis]|uniref:Uncharacterized protein n=1 Tax=Muraenolepis orangiensis TaxID=630683 RepID=A0A9Q0E8T1_9TELE|nr:hypothetical protein NHX12_033999 [Muraenolepis orangiensis]
MSLLVRLRLSARLTARYPGAQGSRGGPFVCTSRRFSLPPPHPLLRATVLARTLLSREKKTPWRGSPSLVLLTHGWRPIHTSGPLRALPALLLWLLWLLLKRLPKILAVIFSRSEPATYYHVWLLDVHTVT